MNTSNRLQRAVTVEHFPALIALDEHLHLRWTAMMVVAAALIGPLGYMYLTHTEVDRDYRYLAKIMLVVYVAVVVLGINALIGAIVIQVHKKRPTIFWGVLFPYQFLINNFIVEKNNRVELSVLVVKAYHASGTVTYTYNPDTKAYGILDLKDKHVKYNPVVSVSLVLVDIDTGKPYSMSHCGPGFCGEFIARLEGQKTIFAWALANSLALDESYLIQHGLVR